MAENSPKRVENTVGKRRNCSLRAISPFPIVFSKDFYCRHVKTRACLGKASVGWLVVLRFNATLTAKVISWRSVTHMFPGFLTPVLARKKFRLNRVSNSQPPGHESNSLTTEPSGRGRERLKWLWMDFVFVTEIVGAAGRVEQTLIRLQVRARRSCYTHPENKTMVTYGRIRAK